MRQFDDSGSQSEFNLSTISELHSLSSASSADVFIDLFKVYRAELSAAVAALQSAITNRDTVRFASWRMRSKVPRSRWARSGLGRCASAFRWSAQGPQLEETIFRARKLIDEAADLPERLERAGAWARESNR
jgi:hypothetical protein